MRITLLRTLHQHINTHPAKCRQIDQTCETRSCCWCRWERIAPADGLQLFARYKYKFENFEINIRPRFFFIKIIQLCSYWHILVLPCLWENRVQEIPKLCAICRPLIDIKPNCWHFSIPLKFLATCFVPARCFASFCSIFARLFLQDYSQRRLSVPYVALWSIWNAQEIIVSGLAGAIPLMWWLIMWCGDYSDDGNTHNIDNIQWPIALALNMNSEFVKILKLYQVCV